MKKEIIINDDWREILEIDKVDVFFENYCNHSQYVSLSTKHCGKLESDQLKTIKLELEEDLKHQILLYKENKDGFADRLRKNLLLDSEKDVNNYFKEIRKNNKQIVREIKKTNYNEDRKEVYLEKLKKIGMIDMKITCMTPITKGPLVDLCYFKPEDILKYIICMEDIYDDIIIEGIYFEEIAFYNCVNGEYEIVACIVSHEHELILYAD